MLKKIKSNRYYKMIAALLIAFILLMGLFIYSKNESKINNRTMTLLVHSDGSVFVEDIWDVNIKNLSTLYQSFDNANSENFSDIRVSFFGEGSQSWIPMQHNKNISYSGKEALNFYHAGMFQGKFEIGWGVGFENTRGKGRYKIEYTVKGPVENYLDTAQYYHMFVGKNFNLPIEKFDALITFPAPINENNSYIWGHGAPSGVINFKDGKVAIQANKIPPNTFVEARVLFPKELVYMAPEIDRHMKSSILAEEQRNTDQTIVASINDENRNRLISIAVAGVMLYVGIVLAYEFVRTARIKQEFSPGFVRKWERYTDLPQTKLDINAANVIYEDKGAMNYLITVLMKLSQNKYLEIIQLKEESSSLDGFDESLMEKTKIAEKVCTDLGMACNPIEIAKILSSVEKEIRAEKAKELQLRVKELSSVRYKLHLQKIEEAEKEDKLDIDEKEVVKFLKLIASGTKISEQKFNQKIIKALKKNKSHLNVEVFKETKRRFIEEVEQTNGIVYIEQYQLIDYLVKHFTAFDTKYKSLIKVEKTNKTKEGIYSLEKEKKYNNLMFKPFFQIGLFALFVYLLLTQLIGNVQFNEQQYIIATVLSLISSVMLLFVHKNQADQLSPHLTTSGLNIREEYQGLYNFLNNDSFIAEYPEESVIIWGEFLVLATYFGIASKVLKALRKVHPQVVTELENTNVSFAQSYFLWNIMDTVTTSKRNIAMVQAATSGFSGSSGGGGGFTSGGGGGFGGGGGGGR